MQGLVEGCLALVFRNVCICKHLRHRKLVCIRGHCPKGAQLGQAKVDMLNSDAYVFGHLCSGGTWFVCILECMLKT